MQERALGIEHVEEIGRAFLILLLAEIEGALGGGDGARLRFGFAGNRAQIDERVFDFLETDEQLLAVTPERLLVASFRGLEVGDVPSAFENGDR